MSSYDALYLTGTLGYLAFIVLASVLLAQWHREQGISWLEGTAGMLAVALISATGGFIIIAVIRLLAQSEQIITASDARIIAGVAPWMAFIALAGRRIEVRGRGQ
jgi:hypothetical protein